MQDYEVFACMEKKTLIEATYRINVIRFKRIMKKEGISIQKSVTRLNVDKKDC